MPKFPVALDRYFFTRLCIVANSDHVPKSGKLNVAPIQKVNVNEDPDKLGEYAASMTVELVADGNADIPYSIDVEAFGFFNVVDETFPAENRIPKITLLAHNVLFGAIREAVAAATSRQAWGPFILGISVLQQKPTVEDNPTKNLAADAP